MPYFEPSDCLLALVAAINGAGLLLRDFDWMTWLGSSEGASFRDEPGRIERATLPELRQLLTAIVRGDRFTEGNLAGAIASGHVLRIVRRLAELAGKA